MLVKVKVRVRVKVRVTVRVTVRVMALMSPNTLLTYSNPNPNT